MASTGLDMWILNNAAAALTGMSAVVFAPLSFLLYIVLSFLIPSSSGMATVSIPILGGLAHQLNFSVETMVMIYSAGNGLVNLFTPTSGAIMGGLALAKIEYSTWLKFGAKLFVVLGVVCMVILTAAMLILPGAAGVAANLVPEEGTLGVRVPDHAFCSSMLRAFGRPVVSTSVNISGEPAALSLAEAPRELVEGVDFVVNPRFEGRPTRKPSSIVAFTEDGAVNVIRK